MTEERLPLNELLRKAGDGDFLRAVAESVLQLLMEADVEGLIGAGRHARAADRLNWRNGYRDRSLTRGLKTTPISRSRSCGPAATSRRSWRRAGTRRKRRWSPSIQESLDRRGVDRRVDEVAQAMGLSGISKSRVSKLCKEIDERVKAFLERPLEGDWPYLCSWMRPT